MKINYKSENLKCDFMFLMKKQIKNRIICEYFSKKTFKSKKYYFDINYRDNKDDNRIYFDMYDKIPLDGAGQDYYYGKTYQYTLEQDCLAIRKYMNNPNEIDCKPIINSHQYVISHVYDTDMIYKKGGHTLEKNGTYIVNSMVKMKVEGQDMSGSSGP